MKIDRLLFWFGDADQRFDEWNNKFFGLARLLTRLLKQNYDGKKIKFINIHFYTNDRYERYPVLPKGQPHLGSDLTFYGVWEIEDFKQLSDQEQLRYVWDRSYEYLVKSAVYIKNDKFLKAVELAYKQGLLLGFNPDYRMVEEDLIILDENYKAAVWANFKEDEMYSKFTLEKANQIVFEKQMDRWKTGNEFFFVAYKSICIEKNSIIIKGHGDVDTLPLKIPISELFK